MLLETYYSPIDEEATLVQESLATEWPLRSILDGILLEFHWNFRRWAMEFQKHCMHF
jgi:hypothetical protein